MSPHPGEACPLPYRYTLDQTAPRKPALTLSPMPQREILRQKKITRLATPSNEGILFEQNGEAFTSGSGEPCLRQDKSGIVLMGVTTLISAEGPAFMSTYPYRDWLAEEIQRANSLKPNAP
ncbi:MAG: hypothetical protein ACJ8AT_32080 [Hyalangium sp.]|uniref:hypothetical protein n=1 Tax=Hyalangium sp. TaxID=2028555 RepID=UPI003899E55E